MSIKDLFGVVKTTTNTEPKVFNDYENDIHDAYTELENERDVLQAALNQMVDENKKLKNELDTARKALVDHITKDREAKEKEEILLLEIRNKRMKKMINVVDNTYERDEMKGIRL